MVDSLVANIPTIEVLGTRGFGDIEEALSGILELKQLKELHFDANYQNTQTSTDEIVIRLIQGLPALEKIEFHCDKISVSEISNILEHSENLTSLTISIRGMDIDLAAYHSILALIKSHLAVKLKIKEGNFDENIFKQNEQRLKIVRRS